MHVFSAKEAKDSFGLLIDLARAAPVTVAKHGRAVIVVMAVEEFERLKQLERHVMCREKVGDQMPIGRPKKPSGNIDLKDALESRSTIPGRRE